eukprot:CAMPEP_0182529854 /NCGR_PEP_ID=MMETSP1323-20130603/5490_1 /TAXON_ID=236787 /ORGANISM="Florenciella parvula, Strain RCC1693" /LENGTH=51 /DNA_ID=CAMNT_0024739099 /DNA_START=99 /DNA_END=254 /DNA_ORIENTATION=-
MAALMPLKVVPISTGKICDGKMNVVHLGPKLEKKNVRAYSTTSSGRGVVLR